LYSLLRSIQAGSSCAAAGAASASPIAPIMMLSRRFM
jgi:hypothetical protein